MAPYEVFDRGQCGGLGGLDDGRRSVGDELAEDVQAAVVQEDVPAQAEDAARPAVAVEAVGAGGDAELAVVQILDGAPHRAEGLAGDAGPRR